MEIENIKTIQRTIFLNYLEEITGLSPSFDSIYGALVIKALSSPQPVGMTSKDGIKCIGLGSKIYSCYPKISSSDHRRGDGGESEHLIFLDCNDRHLLVSQEFRSYVTTADDSQDNSGSHHKAIYLLDDDEIALSVFRELSKFIPEDKISRKIYA